MQAIAFVNVGQLFAVQRVGTEAYTKRIQHRILLRVTAGYVVHTDCHEFFVVDRHAVSTQNRHCKGARASTEVSGV